MPRWPLRAGIRKRLTRHPRQSHHRLHRGGRGHLAAADLGFAYRESRFKAGGTTDGPRDVVIDATGKPAVGAEIGLTATEGRILAALRTPQRVQEYVTGLRANFEPNGDTLRSVRGVLRHREAHCLEAAFVAANELYAELSAKNPKFKKIYDSLKAFRADENVWFRVAENTFDNFNFSMSAQGR